MFKNNFIVQSIRRIFALLDSYFRRRGIIVVIFSFVNSVLELMGLGALLPLILLVLDENIIENSEVIRSIYDFFGFQSPTAFITAICIGVMSIIIVKNVVSLLIIRMQARYSLDLFQYFNNKMMRIFYERNYTFFLNTNSHKIIRDFYTIPNQFAGELVLPMMSLFNEIVMIFLIVVSIMIYKFKIFLILAAVVGPVFILFYRYVRNRILHLNLSLHELSPITWNTLFEIIFGYTDVKLTNTEENFFATHKKNIDKFVKLRVNKHIFNNSSAKVLEISIFLGVIIMVLYGLYLLGSREELLVILSLFALAAYRTMPSFSRIMNAIISIKGNLFTIDILEEANTAPPDYGKYIPEMSFEKEIEVANLSYKYPGKDQLVLDNISFKIEKGDKVGIIGKSGSGKTTLVNLFLQFFEPGGGKILVDGLELDETTHRAWRKHLGYVKQDIYLLDSSLKANIAFGIKEEEIDEAKMWEVIEKASLKEFVDDLPEGVDTIVGERGAQLSGGQRQRIGIARALYSGAKVLMLDEATSALDSKTESEITESIYQLSDENLTLMVIAHRITTLKYCNKIIELENGRVKSIKSYEEVFAEQIKS
ncbi:MAG: ABC transporter ATP-binding protein/permease [Bacteroidia bacterium]|nr:ABC transporter ATP-binding protein/permease [Bacteroidia bacterium]